MSWSRIGLNDKYVRTTGDGRRDDGTLTF